MVEDKGIKEQLAEIKDHLGIGKEENKKDVKEIKFKLPFNINMQKKAAIKQNKVLVFLLKTNGNIDVLYKKIEYGMLIFDPKYHEVTPNQIFIYKGIPTVILPEWRLRPIDTNVAEKEYSINPIDQTDAEAIIIRAVEIKEANKSKKFEFNKSWIWIALIVVVIGYLLFGGGLNGLFAGK